MAKKSKTKLRVVAGGKGDAPSAVADEADEVEAPKKIRWREKNHKGKPILDAHGQEDAAQEVRSRNLPDLEDMDREVKKHNDESSDTLGAMESLRDSK